MRTLTNYDEIAREIVNGANVYFIYTMLSGEVTTKKAEGMSFKDIVYYVGLVESGDALCVIGEINY